MHALTLLLLFLLHPSSLLVLQPELPQPHWCQLQSVHPFLLCKASTAGSRKNDIKDHGGKDHLELSWGKLSVAGMSGQSVRICCWIRNWWATLWLSLFPVWPQAVWSCVLWRAHCEVFSLLRRTTSLQQHRQRSGRWRPWGRLWRYTIGHKRLFLNLLGSLYAGELTQKR